jgi:hypothetical protein
MDSHPSQTMAPGTSVDVFSRFSVSWTSGFEIASSFDDGYQLRRLSDQTVLPKTFPLDDLRVAHRYRQ